jgi:hypothetical protein
MLELLPVLCTESIGKLKRAVLKRPELIEERLEVIAGDLSLTYVPTTYRVSQIVELLMPEGFSQDQNKDSENSTRILQFLPELTPANATDERLWVTLSFGKFGSYLRHRWPYRQNEDGKLGVHIQNHWFAAGVRGRMRDNGISRLWWMGYIASKVPGLSTEEVYQILFANSDYRSSLLERNSSTNSVVVLAAILKVTHSAFQAGKKYDRKSFREFMKEINLLGGYKNLAAIEQDALIEMFTPVYAKCYAPKAG